MLQVWPRTVVVLLFWALLSCSSHCDSASIMSLSLFLSLPQISLRLAHNSDRFPPQLRELPWTDHFLSPGSSGARTCLDKNCLGQGLCSAFTMPQVKRFYTIHSLYVKLRSALDVLRMCYSVKLFSLCPLRAGSILLFSPIIFFFPFCI